MAKSIGHRTPTGQGLWGRGVIGILGLVLLVACGGDDGAPDEGPAATPGETAPVAADEDVTPEPSGPVPVDPATAGSLTGRVRLAGAAPVAVAVELTGDPWCIGEHPEGLSEPLVVGADGGLGQALVWVRGDLGDDHVFDDPSGVAELRQVGCVYTPRVQVVRKRQTLRVHNDDDTLHNVHTRPQANRESNLAQPSGSSPRDLDFRKTEGLFEIVCDVHPWMRCWVAVLDHPFSVVTEADGAFTLTGVPPGSYELGVWHERFGERTIAVTVEQGEAVTVEEVVFGA